MLDRIEWLEYCVTGLLAGNRAPASRIWGLSGNTLSRDVDLLRQAAKFVSLRSEAAQPDPSFVARLRERMLAEAGCEE
jgi:hypothetical protein